MEKDSIALLPGDGYLSNILQSIKALKWFHYLKKTRGIELQHYGRGREVKVAGFKVDAYHEPSMTVFKFYGDYFHGNPNKYHGTTLNMKTGTRWIEKG